MLDSRQTITTEVAARLGIRNPEWLAKLIDFETAGTWNPKVKNPTSSARGLLQFMDATARSMGYESSLDLVTKNPTFETQMFSPVMQYLNQWSSYPTAQSLYMSVFYPRYRKSPPDTVFSDTVQSANPGIQTVADYNYKVDSRNLPSWWVKDAGHVSYSPSSTKSWWQVALGVTVFALVRALFGRGKK